MKNNTVIMEWFLHTLREYPELAIFLTLALGTLLGKLRYKTVSLGSVTGVLIAGVFVGQLNIEIAPIVKSTFFLLFLFAVGFGVGPQFFNSLKKEGLPQIFFAAILCVLCLLSGWAAAEICGFGVGLGSGLYAGSSTISAVIGVASDAINQLPLSAEQKKIETDAIPVAYAVTYLFGTAGSAWILASLAPKILGINFEESCKELEKQMGSGDNEPGVISAYEPIGMRAYKLESEEAFGGTVRELEARFQPHRVFVERIRRGNDTIEAAGSLSLSEGDILAIGGKREDLVKAVQLIGTEVDDPSLLNFPAETLDLVVTRKEYFGKTLQELAEVESGKPSRGIFVRKILRGSVELPVTHGLKLARGDVITLSGAKRDVERVARHLGYADRVTDATDILFLSVGILFGALIGALAFHIGSVPISLSTSGGVLIAGLICGWLRSTHHRLGRIPGPAVWAFNNVGLAVFIAVVGIDAGPQFVEGLKNSGVALLIAGAIATTVPLILGLLIGKFFFKMHPAILIGACAGARTTTAALG
ncbi:MAG: aspartate-alanine antiporter, partial [Puniceicoccales bacterium]|nr:aspartate-alanine antiporter [Puniceicoccales bacterium]